MEKPRYKHKLLTNDVIHASYVIHNELGSGFLEKVYRNALVVELKKMGHSIEIEKPLSVFYQGQIIGEYYADIVVGNQVVLEIKAVQGIAPAHEAQLVNYLKATRIEVGLLLNFGGGSVQVRRKVYETAREKNNSKKLEADFDASTII
jgi:GxxExxY protein